MKIKKEGSIGGGPRLKIIHTVFKKICLENKQLSLKEYCKLGWILINMKRVVCISNIKNSKKKLDTL